ncbi:UdgX family uracil-DNA binding protein [Sphingobium sp. B12D2B]|uniref:UdgX family uracil-DNA binding protein n=1 Tax=Sphingobium sp. B12D2B TaxID=2940577 RepID=UPI0039B41D3B|nr:DNA polymerase [Sphingobium sp. B12D2B]
MRPAPLQDQPALFNAELEDAHDFDTWRELARALVLRGVSPEHIRWAAASDSARDLFASKDTPEPAPSPRPVTANKRFIELARKVILHSSDTRLALLYRLLWRLQSDPHLLEKTSDADVHALTQLERQVRRDIHKMRAFVRFRLAHDPDGTDRYVAWFEPDHAIVRANAPFFLNRFASQRWSILTPDLSLHWDGTLLAEGPGADSRDAPGEDEIEGLWQRYYASIFNPARLKVAMMVKEMPRRYWKNLPEAALIPALIAGAQAREAQMVDQGADPFQRPPPTSLGEIAEGISTCTACPIGCNGTRAVAGEGPGNARLMIVGEQPGDFEEQQGRPFVGPAGQLLDGHLETAGFDRPEIRLTNAVKHFKFEQRGKRRLHQNPTAGEIDHCRWWLDAERRIVQPTIVLALGASAGRALLGRTPSIAKERGQPYQLADGSQLWLSAHPSYLLRLSGEAQTREQTLFARDLAAVRVALQG